MATEDGVARWVIKNLPHDASDAAVVAALEAKNSGDLLVLFFNWWNRIPSTQPRKIFRSRQLLQNDSYIDRRTSIDSVIENIEIGTPLFKYLSRRTQIGFELPKNAAKKKLNRARHIDLLLNEWGIHHLHISSLVEDDGFVKRDGPLLFAALHDDTAYIIDIGDHNSFSDDRLAHIVIDNWPDSRIFVELQGIRPSRDRPYTQSERRQLRGAGIASFVQIGQRLFAPSNGISTAGTSITAVRRANHMLRTLRDFDKIIEEDPSSIFDYIRKHYNIEALQPEFEFSVVGSYYGVREKKHGVFVPLGT